ncbi:MAG: sulfur carrier protein ThiS adenylyltransferase ThiF [Phycisphaeraceae bacterium]|nr:sulfur carrier protein ThiS adenylyltransferase ThiF [Phycisphaeraceae bacterium]
MKPFDDKLARAVVGIAGLGGLGSMVAAALARTCVGRLILCDFDQVEETNLNRQNYFEDQVGMRKVDASLLNLKRINPHVTLEPHHDKLFAKDIPRVFKDAHVICECFDKADQKQMLVETVLAEMDVPIVTASGLAGVGQSNLIRTQVISDRLTMVGDQTHDINLGLPLTAGRVWIAAAHQANAIVEHLINA